MVPQKLCIKKWSLRVRGFIKPGSSKSLWVADQAEDKSIESMTDERFNNGLKLYGRRLRNLIILAWNYFPLPPGTSLSPSFTKFFCGFSYLTTGLFPNCTAQLK